MFRVLSTLALAAASLQGAIVMASAAEVFPTEPKPAEPTTEWIGFAASPTKRVFKEISQSEVTARDAAKFECEKATGRTCDAIAVPSSWDVSVVYCTGSGLSPASFVGGSIQDLELQVAYSKAHKAGFDPSNCVKIFSY